MPLPPPGFPEFNAKLSSSIQQILRLPQLNLFERRNLIELLKPVGNQPTVYSQLLLWAKLRDSSGTERKTAATLFLTPTFFAATLACCALARVITKT